MEADPNAVADPFSQLDEETRRQPDAPPSFTCTACGECCRTNDPDKGVTLNYADVVRIAAHLGMGVPDFVEQRAARFEIALGEDSYEAFHLRFENGSCVFLNDDNRCGIHSVKPWQCRFTPYRFFYEGERDLWCMKDVEVPTGWTSGGADAVFVAGLRKVSGSPSADA
jgi:Fe-S-cluster containining protein